MVPLRLFTCLLGITSPLLASPAVTRAAGEADGLSEDLISEHALQGRPLLQRAESSVEDAMALQSSQGQSSWWDEMKERGVNCKGCNSKIPKFDWTCEGNELLDEHFDNAIEAAGLLNDVGEDVPKKNMRYIRYGSVVIWVCNCAGKQQDYPRDQLSVFGSKLKNECSGSKAGHSRKSGWIYFIKWHKGFNVDTYDSFHERLKSGDTGCGKGCLK